MWSVLLGQLFLYPLVASFYAFPSFDWINKQSKKVKKEENGQKLIDISRSRGSKEFLFPWDENNGLQYKEKLKHQRGQEPEEFSFGDEPNNSPHKGQEVEEFTFGRKSEKLKQQKLKDLYFGSHPEINEGREVEEINFGQKPQHSKEQELEEFSFHKPKRSQKLQEYNFEHKPEELKGQELEEFRFNSKPQHEKGQEVEEINFGQKPEHQKGQELEDISFGYNPKPSKGQEIEEFNFGPKPELDKGQELEEINFGHKPHEPKGQEIEEFHFGSNPKPNKGQEVEEINFGHKPDVPKGQEMEEFHFGSNPKPNKGQEVEEINFGYNPHAPKGQEVEEINFGHNPYVPKGQEVEDFSFGSNPKPNKGQEVEEINFGHKPEEPKGQEVEEFHFGSNPKPNKGQEVEEINFGHKPDVPKGQEMEEFHFGSNPKPNKGQEVEEINFGYNPHAPKGQEVEEINFGHNPYVPKGQEVEDFSFGSNPKPNKGQEVEEINFGHKPEEPKGQEVEEFHFGSNPKPNKGQEVEEINFGHKPDVPKGQETEEFHFGSNPKPNKEQEVEEITIGHKPDEPQTLKPDHNEQEVTSSVLKPKEPKRLKPEDHKKEEPIKTTENPKSYETGKFEPKPEEQETEEISFGSKPKDPKHVYYVTPEDNWSWLNVFKHAAKKNDECQDKPEVPINSVMHCDGFRKCKATCPEGFQFPNNLPEVIYECTDGKWLTNSLEKSKFECQPVCVPPCQNEGVCVSPNQCSCKKHFEGPQCQFGNKPCLNHPPVSQNSQVHCNASHCRVECFYTYSFPDGTSETNLLCHQGKWILERSDWTSLPDCKPSCHPPCMNGGTCLDYNKCQCPRRFAGPQCQYEISVCDGKKLNFNGIYTCRGESDKVVCRLDCPDGYNADPPLAAEYICHYSTGKFSPDPVPKCVYGKDVEVMKFASSSHTIDNGGFEVFESSKLAPPPSNAKPAECTTWKNSHFKTFDDKVYSFNGDCSYTLVQDVDNVFRIVIDYSNCKSTTCSRILKIFYQEKEYSFRFEVGSPIFAVNDLMHSIPIQLLGFSVEKKKNEILIYLETPDVFIVWNKEDRLSVKVNPNLWNRVNGLCGNFNNDPHDDLQTPRGIPAWDLKMFVQEWVNDPYNCQSTPEVEGTCADYSAIDYCQRVFGNSNFEKCMTDESLKRYEEACVWDVCKCGKSCACATINEFVENCKKYLVSQDIPDSTSQWRDIADCPWHCPPGKVYSFCGPSIEATCGSFEMSKSISKHSACVEGCFCPEGMLLHNDTCVSKERCPCQWRNKNYNTGERIAKGCNTCTCQDREWICTNLKCESRCSVTGNSHYQTFDGKKYDYSGQCSYYLVKTANYTIESENFPCVGEIEQILATQLSSCSKGVTIRHAQDEIKLKKHNQVFVNKEEILTIPFDVNGVVIRSASTIYLRVTLPDGADIWWDGNSNIYIDFPGNHESSLGGLCGTYNNNQRDDFATPEGDIEQSAVAFAEKWKTDETCEETFDQHQPHPCDSNPKYKLLAEQHCEKLKHEVFRDCHSFVNVEEFYKNCLHDVCSCQSDLKVCFCPILADYGNECMKQGIEVPWRNEIRECGLHCPHGQVYQPCGDSCTRTCEDISLSAQNYCNKKCVEGCSCPEGLTLNSKGQCIPISQCPCYHQNIKYKANKELIMESKKGPQFCTCENALWNCRPATKLEIDRDYENSNIKCNESLHEEYTTCEPAEPRTCKNMHEKPKHTTRICFPGCVCKKGYVWDSIGKVCVNASECPCHHGGRSYLDGEKIQEDCNTCTCENGMWSCTERECPAVCSTWGDSHFKTFDGRVYDFQGSCDFVLATGSISEYDTFVVNLQIVPCGSTGISCPKSVTVKVGSRHKEEEVVFRKSIPTTIPNDLERIVVREAGLFVFAEIFDLGITVQWDKGTRVYVKADPKWKNRVKGLCGNFNNNELDDFKTPSSGETSEISPVVFADSWRLQSYCPESYQITDTCSRRPHRKPWAVKKCSILKSETFEPCHSEVPFEPYLERCVLDTCGCDEGGDCECLCTAIAAYAEECTIKGVPLKWRTQDMCPLQCDEKNSKYSSCISSCPPKSCDNQFKLTAILQTCSEESCVEGCEKEHCPPNHVFADSTMTKCVPVTSCKSVCLTVNNITYLEGDLMESDDCHSCFCSHHAKTCTGQPCAEITTTTPLLIPETTTELHTTPIPPPTTAAVCPPGQVWDNCITTCGHLCNYLAVKIRNQTQCLDKDDCVSGCRATELNCPPDLFLRDEQTCVHKKDCPCVSTSGTLVKPGEVNVESECEKCQCVNNEYECMWVCTSPTYTPEPTANYTKIRHTVTTGMEFGHEGNVTLIFLTTPSTPPVCPTGLYESLINENTKFSASSQSDEFSSASQCTMDLSGWTAAYDNADQYLQIDLGQVEPVFAVNVAGASGKYVTGYHLLHSINGHKFFDIINRDGKKEIFGGPVDDHQSVKQVLPIPVEARYIRFQPISWHEGITMKVDVLGCKNLFVSTTAPPTTHIPSICDKPIGIGQKYFPKLKIIVTSSKPNTGPDYIGFDNEKGWQPLTNSKSEWVQFDFGEYVNFTGVVTKGVSQSNDLSTAHVAESWVERYKVEYSHDGFLWNPILDDFGHELIFMGNSDSESPKTNYFTRPVHAKALRITPFKWHNNIALRLDLLGCYETPRIETEVTPPVVVSESTCNLCKGVIKEDEHCDCVEDKWWDGVKCVNQSECPCFVGLIAYPVGTTFTTEKCEECVCRIFGVPSCSNKICEDCPDGLQKILTPLCGCTCKPCEKNTRLCPSTNICLNESSWCDGVQDCPDDETDCTTPTPLVTPTPKPCKPSCPPGYDVAYRNQTAGPSEAEHMLEYPKKSVTSKKSVKTYRKSKKSKKYPRLEKLTDCPPYDCVPPVEVTPEECPIPECPLDYTLAHKKQMVNLENACPLYSCEPIPEFANCSVESRNIKTFDGTEYRYDICDHMLATHDSGLWNISMFKTCSYLSPCVPGLLIHHEAHSLELHPQNKTILFDQFPFNYNQAELINSKIEGFTLNPIGNSIIFTSDVHGFAVVYEPNGNIRITVPGQTKNHLAGLCGLYNGHKMDDKTLPNGNVSKTTVEFGNSWFNPGGKECIETTCPIEMQNIAYQTCLKLKKEPFTSCSKEVNLEICIESTCNCLTSNKTEEECRCQILSDFAGKCKSPELFGWRVEHDCPSTCPPNLVHYDCYPYACEPTCRNEDCTEPADECYSGCFCPDGLVKKGDQCIKLQDCRDCVCSGMGDSTYLTFDGALTFNGNCTYIAVKEKNPSATLSFEVLITNNLCNGSDFMTCTEKLEVRIPEHSVKLVALPHTEEKILVMVDDFTRELNEFSHIDLGWSKIFLNLDTSSILVELPKHHVDVRYFYNRFAFTISLPSRYYSDKVEGLCGSCSNREDFEMENPEIWQIQKDESCIIEPPTHCAPTPMHEKLCEALTDPSVFGQCLNFVDPAPFIDQCLASLCANGHVCHSLEAYSQACRDVGICVDWRSHNFCPYTCPSDLVYEACKRGCLKTCENLEEPTSCDKQPLEGCFCPDDKVLINGTCKDQKYCKYCDEEGRHYEDEEWQVDKCTNCSCRDRIVTCNRVECPTVDLVCKEDEIIVREDNDVDCCPKYKCGCKPRQECAEIETPKEDLALGMEAVVNETGCCPKVEIICKKENCPEPKPCRPHYIQKTANTSDCCPEHICVKPDNLCIFEYVHQKEVEKRETPKEIVKEVGERWTDGPCKNCVCVERDGVAEAVCMVTECPRLEEHHDYEEYELVPVHNTEKCCPEIARKNCKHNGTIYQVGDSWMPNDNNPCETMKCNHLGNGLILKETRLEICRTDCEPGWEYKHLEGACCGHCVEVGCLIGDKIYRDGESWISEDQCSKTTCLKKNGRFITSTMTESCPSIEDCPKEDIYKDKCCLKCKIRTENKKICTPVPLPLETTIHLVKEKKGKHGMCHNLEPIHNFTECAGNCDSFTVFKPETFTHEKSCKCCQPEEYSLLTVKLNCQDGLEVIKSITVPSKCSCMPCVG